MGNITFDAYCVTMCSRFIGAIVRSQIGIGIQNDIIKIDPFEEGIFGQYSEINKRDAKGDTPLIRALKAGDIDKSFLFLRCGADVNIQNINGYNALMYACMLRSETLVTEMMLHEPDFELYNEDTDSALMLICRDPNNANKIEKKQNQTCGLLLLKHMSQPQLLFLLELESTKLSAKNDDDEDKNKLQTKFLDFVRQYKLAEILKFILSKKSGT